MSEAIKRKKVFKVNIEYSGFDPMLFFNKVDQNSLSNLENVEFNGKDTLPNINWMKNITCIKNLGSIKSLSLFNNCQDNTGVHFKGIDKEYAMNLESLTIGRVLMDPN